MSKSKKITLLVLGLLIVCLSFTGVSYAMWQVNHSQSDENIVNVGCFEISTDLGTNLENSAISLDKHFPISDVEGMKLTPFTFTITNTCTTIAAFQVNLETMSTSTIGKQYIKVAVNNNKSILNTLGSVETTIANASSSNMLESGSLYPGQSISFDIRLWVDEATTIEDLGADDPNNNLTYAAKVTLATSAKMYTNTAVDTIMKLVEGEGSSSTDVITKDAPNGATCTNTLAYDNTADNNLRYVGSNPCNYVCFNGECPTDVTKYYVKNVSTGNDANWGIYDSLDSCELDVDNSTDYECTPITMADGGWRIIGVMNNVDDGTGKNETRLKLIRNDSLGDYSWDVSPKTIDNGYGINEWAASSTYDGADIMRELNTDYINTNLTNNPMWFSYQEGYTDSNYAIGRGQNTEFDRTKVLTTNAQELIGDAIWHTGTYDDTSENNSDINASQVYINEKNNNPSSTNNGKYCSNTYSDCNDEITRTTTWKGLVALINVSDYMYSTSGGLYIKQRELSNNKYDG